MDHQSIVRMALDEFREKAIISGNDASRKQLIRECARLFESRLKDIFTDIQNEPDGYDVQEPVQVRAEYWCRLPAWSSDEAACLALQCDPDDVERVRNGPVDVQRKFVDFKRAVDRHIEAGNFAFPSAIFLLLKDLGAEFPDTIRYELKKKIRDENKHKRRYDNSRKSQIKNGKHRDSYLKLVYVFCVRRFEYSKGGGSSAVDDIVSEADSKDVKIDPKTVRSLLNLAVDRSKFLIKKSNLK